MVYCLLPDCFIPFKSANLVSVIFDLYLQLTLLHHRNPHETDFYLFKRPMPKAEEDGSCYWSTQSIGKDSINAFGPAVEALIDEDKWPFRLSYAINNAVLRSGNFCALLRAGTPDYVASLCIHATTRSIAVANRQVDSNMKPYGRELMFTMDDIVRVALIIASGLNQLRCMLSTCFHISMLTWLVHELKHATFT